MNFTVERHRWCRQRWCTMSECLSLVLFKLSRFSSFFILHKIRSHLPHRYWLWKYASKNQKHNASNMCHDITIHYLCSICSYRYDFEKHGLECNKARAIRLQAGQRRFASCGREYPQTIWHQDNTCMECGVPPRTVIELIIPNWNRYQGWVSWLEEISRVIIVSRDGATAYVWTFLLEFGSSISQCN